MTAKEDESKGSAAPEASTAQDAIDETAFWNINIPKSFHTAECPDYLEYALESEKDRGILSTLDEDYHQQTWDEVRQSILDNQLDVFERLPSDLRRYREYTHKLKQDYGSVLDYVKQERLKWDDLTPSGEPFSNPDDIKTLYNDWPYGIDPRIVHLVVWTKFELESAPVTDENPNGDLTPEFRKKISDYVDETFVSVCKDDSVVWFKNWSSLKSIHAVEHFHVFLFDPDMDFIKEITNGDVPPSQGWKAEWEKGET